MSYTPAQSPMAETSPILEPSPVFDSSNLRGRTQRNRKSASTGGGRAWSGDEVRVLCMPIVNNLAQCIVQETYLIETRNQKMPYKHIAVHLKKTELACRLHYHQLSYGNKNRRRAASISSVGSTEWSSASPLDRRMHDTPQRQLPPFSLPSTPETNRSTCNNQSASPQNHIPILPKPQPTSQRTVHQSKALRLITDDIKQFKERQVIDTTRLNRIYDTHRISFWSIIAQNYGCNLSPATLEEAWHQSQAVFPNNLPLTPCTSPRSAEAPSIPTMSASAVANHSKGFTPINTPRSSISAPSAADRGTFAISFLLTVDKEVRSLSQEQKRQDCEMR